VSVRYSADPTPNLPQVLTATDKRLLNTGWRRTWVRVLRVQQRTARRLLCSADRWLESRQKLAHVHTRQINCQIVLKLEIFIKTSNFISAAFRVHIKSLLISVVVNYPALPRSGLLAPRLVRTGLPVSASELLSDVDTAVPDSAGDFPSQVVRSVPLLPDGHSTTTDGARFLSRLNTVITVTVRDVMSIVLPDSPVWVVK